MNGISDYDVELAHQEAGRHHLILSASSSLSFLSFSIFFSSVVLYLVVGALCP